MGKKQEVLIKLFQICQHRNDYTFDNDLVKNVCREIGFGNPFDVTKIDNISVLPNLLRENDYAVIHIGDGQHKFIQGIANIYHSFEPVNTTVEWKYRKSLLNEYNSSESNILSVANNQRILHHFLFGEDREFDNADIALRPKTYFPHRTKTNLEYFFGQQEKVTATQIQIEIDLTIEYKGVIGIFEAKNGQPDNFSVYQLYHPFLYYHNARQRPELQSKIRDILCTYIVRTVKEGNSELRLWCYKFTNPLDITSIVLQQAACYKLIGQP